MGNAQSSPVDPRFVSATRAFNLMTLNHHYLFLWPPDQRATAKMYQSLFFRNGEGPTIFIIKDKEDCIYEGYASQPWERHGNFYGHIKSFLFQLYPKASIFKPTGANNNVQWVCSYLYVSPVK